MIILVELIGYVYQFIMKLSWWINVANNNDSIFILRTDLAEPIYQISLTFYQKDYEFLPFWSELSAKYVRRFCHSGQKKNA